MSSCVHNTYDAVYKSNHYVDCVGECVEASMQKAVESAKSAPGYSADGEVHV